MCAFGPGVCADTHGYHVANVCMRLLYVHVVRTQDNIHFHRHEITHTSLPLIYESIWCPGQPPEEAAFETFVHYACCLYDAVYLAADESWTASVW